MPNYVDKDEFRILLAKYKKTKSKKLYNQIGKIFISIAERFSRYPRFINYSADIKMDSKSDSIFYMIKYMDNYDEKKGDPFSYFTMYAYNAFLMNVYKFYKTRDMFESYTFIENMDDDFMSRDLMKKYKEIPKIVQGDLKALLKDIEDIDKIQVKDKIENSK
jgi:hypothetical protein